MKLNWNTLVLTWGWDGVDLKPTLKKRCYDPRRPRMYSAPQIFH